MSPKASVPLSQENIIASQGDSLTLSCSALGGPSNNFQWEKDGIVVGNDSMLELVDIGASDGGNYSCNVSNAAGHDTVTSTVFVRPYIITPLDSQVLTKVDGSALNITCDVDGFPGPSVMWFEIAIDGTERKVSNTSELRLSPVTFGDEGVYRCIAITEIDRTNYTTMDNTTLIGRVVQACANLTAMIIAESIFIAFFLPTDENRIRAFW